MPTPDEIIKRYDELMSAESVDDYEEKERELLREAIDALIKSMVNKADESVKEFQEGKSLDELAGEGHVAKVGKEGTAMTGAVHDWLEKYQGKSVRELLENTPQGVCAKYNEDTKVLTINPSLPTEKNVWTEYQTNDIIEVRPYVPGQDDDILCRPDRTPELGDYVARKTDDHMDQWILFKSTYDREHKKTY